MTIIPTAAALRLTKTILAALHADLDATIAEANAAIIADNQPAYRTAQDHAELISSVADAVKNTIAEHLRARCEKMN